MKHQPYTPQVGDLKVAQDKELKWRIYAYRKDFRQTGYIWSELGFEKAYDTDRDATSALLAHLEREEETGVKVR